MGGGRHVWKSLLSSSGPGCPGEAWPSDLVPICTAGLEREATRRGWLGLLKSLCSWGRPSLHSGLPPGPQRKEGTGSLSRGWQAMGTRSRYFPFAGVTDPKREMGSRIGTRHILGPSLRMCQGLGSIRSWARSPLVQPELHQPIRQRGGASTGTREIFKPSRAAFRTSF